MTHEFEDGARIEYVGGYVNMLGVGVFLGYEREGAQLWAHIKVNGARARVMPDNLRPAPDPNLAARSTQLAHIGAASPMRPPAGRTAPIDGLALFDHGRQPDLF